MDEGDSKPFFIDVRAVVMALFGGMGTWQHGGGGGGGATRRRALRLTSLTTLTPAGTVIETNAVQL